MAVSFRAAGAYVNGTANLIPVIPAGTVAGDIMICFVGTKPFDGVNTMTAGWTSLGFGTDGIIAAGTDIGSMKAEAFFKVHTGTEANPTVTNTTNNVSGAVIVSFQKAPERVWYLGSPLGFVNECLKYNLINNNPTGELSYQASFNYTLCDGTEDSAFVNAQQSSTVCSRVLPVEQFNNINTEVQALGICSGVGAGDGEPGTQYTVSQFSITDYQNGDFLAGMIALRSDVSTIGAITITGAGLTISAFTKSPGTDLLTTAGGDMRMSVGRANITAGSGSVALTMSSTLSGSQTGSSFIVRLRDVIPPSGGYYDPFGVLGIFGI